MSPADLASHGAGSATDRRDEALRRLRGTRSQLDAVIRMVEADRCCVDVLHQILAVQGALERSRRVVLDTHLRACVVRAYADGTYDAVVTEVLDAIHGTGSPRPHRRPTRGRTAPGEPTASSGSCDEGCRR